MWLNIDGPPWPWWMTMRVPATLATPRSRNAGLTGLQTRAWRPMLPRRKPDVSESWGALPRFTRYTPLNYHGSGRGGSQMEIRPAKPESSELISGSWPILKVQNPRRDGVLHRALLLPPVGSQKKRPTAREEELESVFTSVAGHKIRSLATRQCVTSYTLVGRKGNPRNMFSSKHAQPRMLSRGLPFLRGFNMSGQLGLSLSLVR